MKLITYWTPGLLIDVRSNLTLLSISKTFFLYPNSKTPAGLQYTLTSWFYLILSLLRFLLNILPAYRYRCSLLLFPPFRQQHQYYYMPESVTYHVGTPQVIMFQLGEIPLQFFAALVCIPLLYSSVLVSVC
jgi:hypothetical protein